MKQPRIFMGMIEVAGYFSHLKKGFDALGVVSTVSCFTPNTHGYDYDKDWGWYKRFMVRFCSKPRPTFLQIAVLAPYLLWVLYRYNIFIFCFSTCLFGDRGLRLLKFLGKTVIHVYLGNDSRPPYLSSGQISGNVGKYLENVPTRKLVTNSAECKGSMRMWEKYADYIINHEPQAQFAEKPFVSWNKIGFPKSFSLHDIAPPNKIPRILHAPTNRFGKGTYIIRKLMDDIKEATGIEVDYVEVTGRPNEEVIEEIKKCDFVVDEVFSDAPMGGLSAEAAAYGKPAVVSGYVDTSKLGTEKERPPTLYVHPERLGDAIVAMCEDVMGRQALGLKARRFVLDRWSAKNVAKRYLRLIEGKAPRSWFVDPKSLDYVHGCGLPQDMLSHILSELIRKEGVGALQLNDKPRLVEKILKLAGIKIVSKDGG